MRMKFTQELYKCIPEVLLAAFKVSPKQDRKSNLLYEQSYCSTLQRGGRRGQKVSKGLHFKMASEAQRRDYKAIQAP